MTTLPTWLSKSQKHLQQYADSLPIKARYGLNMPAFFDHEVSAKIHAPTFRWHGPEEIRLLPLVDNLDNKALKNYLEKHFARNTDTSRIAALTSITSTDGIIIDIPANYQEEKSLTLQIKSSSAGISFGHIVIIARTNSKITLITDQEGNETSSIKISIFVEKDAQLNHIATTRESAKTQFSQHRYYVAERGQVTHIDTNKAAYQGERSIQTYLEGAFSKAEHYHLSVLSSKAKYDLQSVVTHSAPNTTSGIFARAVLDDQSHMIYRGMINVEDGARDSISNQKEATLMLSPTAKIDAIPMLNIINDQVQCSHSASMSNFDPEKLFYMATRGLTPLETKQMLIRSFVQTDLLTITDIGLKTWLQDNLDKLLAL